ncbi:FkbM family methyltransferase [Hoeflea sp.]|uniref:FkbM family methyltransferase n=1 Tax=Hoeflea sp. TaxID=1940281 RepID=UPI003B5281BF
MVASRKIAANPQDHEQITRFLGTFAFVKPGGIGDIGQLSDTDIEHLMQELGWRAMTQGQIRAISNASADSWFKVSLNGVQMELPRYTVMTMRHCLHVALEGPLSLMVETAHWQKMRDEIVVDTLFLDVGAATGAMSVPFALSTDDSVRYVAFEPSLRARGYIQSTIDRNKVTNVKVLPYAVSDGPGTLGFVELPEDETGDTPYLPEASRLSIESEVLDFPGQIKYDVEVTTLDALEKELDYAGAGKLVIKIDVEGFEDKVLLGAMETIKRYKPFLSIDIHLHPGKDIMTDAACREILAPLGYDIERSGHVMIARPR